jgi:diguanylate cyclase (GGDEF)-like protein
MTLLAGSLLFLGLATVVTAEGAALAIDGMPAPAWGWIALTVPLAAVALLSSRLESRTVHLLVAGLIMVFTFIYAWETGFFWAPLGPAVETAAFLILSTVVGLTQRRGVPTGWVVVMLGTFVLVAAAIGEGGLLVIGAVLGTPLCMAQGEVVAWSQERLRVARSRELRWATDLHTLTSSIGRLRRGVPSHEAAATVAGLAHSLLRADDAYVVLVDADGGLRPPDAPPFEFSPRAQGLAERAMGDRQPMVSPDLEGDVLVLPLVAHGTPLGAVLARRRARRHEPFDEVTLQLGELLSAEAANVLAQLRTMEDLAAETQIDALTGVGNRRHAEHLLAVMRSGDAVILFDLDGFKPVNDTYGHGAGDRVLCELTAFLQKMTRREDSVARLGGDEFLLVLRADEGDPFSVADRLRTGWDQTGPLSTMSIGVALHDGSHPSGTTLERADQALYRAKERGGNCVEVYRPTRLPPRPVGAPGLDGRRDKMGA